MDVPASGGGPATPPAAQGSSQLQIWQPSPRSRRKRRPPALLATTGMARCGSLRLIAEAHWRAYWAATCMVWMWIEQQVQGSGCSLMLPQRPPLLPARPCLPHLEPSARVETLRRLQPRHFCSTRGITSPQSLLARAPAVPPAVSLAVALQSLLLLLGLHPLTQSVLQPVPQTPPMLQRPGRVGQCSWMLSAWP